MKVTQLVRNEAEFKLWGLHLLFLKLLASCLPSDMRTAKPERNRQTTERASDILGGLVKTQIAGPHLWSSHSVGLDRA